MLPSPGASVQRSSLISGWRPPTASPSTRSSAWRPIAAPCSSSVLIVTWGIAIAIILAAVNAGHSAMFRTASDLLADLQCDSPQARRRKFSYYARPRILCIDEVGYLSYDSNAADLLYEIVNRRYERSSLLITTNRGFKDWNQVFPNATCIATLLDRLTHHAEIAIIEGKVAEFGRASWSRPPAAKHHRPIQGAPVNPNHRLSGITMLSCVRQSIFVGWRDGHQNHHAPKRSDHRLDTFHAIFRFLHFMMAVNIGRLCKELLRGSQT
jgi:hypothetical protein